MYAIISIISGISGFIIIAGMQINLFLLIKLNSVENPLIPAVYSIGTGMKILVLVLGLIAIFSSILYTQKEIHKMMIINRLGIF